MKTQVAIIGAGPAGLLLGALLAKAGAEGLTVNLSVADSVLSGAVDMAVLYAAQAEAAEIMKDAGYN